MSGIFRKSLRKKAGVTWNTNTVLHRGPHFAALQMLQDTYTLDLLVLEATGATANGNEYRRVGVLTVRYFHKDDVAPPEIIDFFKEMDASLTARLQES